MTPEQIELIRSSFAKIYLTKDQSAKIFYDRLFALAPSTRALFKNDMHVQGRKLVDMLALAVATLRNQESLYSLLYETAKRHVNYGVAIEHYKIVGDALLWMLKKQLGAEWTPAVMAAWSELYAAVAKTMQRITKDAPAVA